MEDNINCVHCGESIVTTTPEVKDWEVKLMKWIGNDFGMADEFTDTPNDIVIKRSPKELQSFIRTLLSQAKQEGRDESHKTEDGYCCACEYDIAGFQQALKEAKEETTKEAVGKVFDELEYVDNELTWGDTEYNSNAVRYGYNLAIQSLNNYEKDKTK
jgi:hypothetical protein